MGLLKSLCALQPSGVTCAVTNVSELGAEVAGGVLMWNATSPRFTGPMLPFSRSVALPATHALVHQNAILRKALQHLQPPPLMLSTRNMCMTCSSEAARCIMSLHRLEWFWVISIALPLEAADADACLSHKIDMVWQLLDAFHCVA